MTHYPIGIPKPINDTTQNLEASGERSGMYFLGARWTSSIAYSGSLYHNNLKELDAQNPLCTQTGAPTCDVTGASLFTAPTALRLSLDPSNMANAVTWNTAADVPLWKTRYVSTMQYNNMRQNDPFIDTSINGLTALPVTLNGIPVNGLNGQIGTTTCGRTIRSLTRASMASRRFRSLSTASRSTASTARSAPSCGTTS
jgi:hypothetical protein